MENFSFYQNMDVNLDHELEILPMFGHLFAIIAVILVSYSIFPVLHLTISPGLESPSCAKLETIGRASFYIIYLKKNRFYTLLQLKTIVCVIPFDFYTYRRPSSPPTTTTLLT